MSPINTTLVVLIRCCSQRLPAVCGHVARLQLSRFAKTARHIRVAIVEGIDSKRVSAREYWYVPWGSSLFDRFLTLQPQARLLLSAKPENHGL